MTRAAVVIKAILATLIAGLGALGTALTDGSVSGAELTGTISAALVAASVVWAVPNANVVTTLESTVEEVLE